MNKTLFVANRFLASLIDGFFMLVITVGISIFPSINFFKEISDGKLVSLSVFWFVFSLMASFLVWILYLSIPCLIFKNATLGMRLCHLRFENSKEKDVKFYHILFREATLVVCIVFSLGLSLISDIISVCSNSEGRTFFDYYSSLRVVNDYA